MTLNDHWGYNAVDQNWKSSTDLIRKLADICAKGGNFLLNVGPTAEGEFPPACVERLRDIGQWLKVNGVSIYETSRGPFAHLPWGVATRKDQTIFLHVFDWPQNGKLVVPLNNPAKSAKLLATGAALPVKAADGRLVIDMPATAPELSASIIALEITGEPVTRPLPTVGAVVTASASMPGSEPANVIDGTIPATSYQPTALDVEQWVQTAYEAGMRYVIIISKHHDGFCMWDSPWTNYDVGSSSVPTDVIAAAAAACKKYGIKLGIYYSLWDRHEHTYSNDDSYNQYMLCQLRPRSPSAARTSGSITPGTRPTSPSTISPPSTTRPLLKTTSSFSTHRPTVAAESVTSSATPYFGSATNWDSRPASRCP